MTKINCPKGEWSELVENMQECVYDSLIVEPNIPELKEDIKKNCPTITKDDLESTIQFLAGRYHNGNLQARSRIDKYGETYTEVCETLRKHIQSCPGCKTEYLKALDSYSEAMEGLHKCAEDLGVTQTKDYLNRISTYDFLKILQPRK